MSRLIIVILFLLALLSNGVMGRDLSIYPCDVFSYDVCFRLPIGTNVDFSVPVDFQLYKVYEDGGLIATIYIGNAPVEIQEATLMRRIRTSRGIVSIYIEKQLAQIKIEAFSEERSVIHISSFVALKNSMLRDLLSSFRPCTPIKSGGQSCGIYKEWSDAIDQTLFSNAE